MSVCASESDCGSYMETSDSEDQVVNESEFSVHALGILSSLDESIGKIDDFLAYDRGFVPGDIVSSISNPSGQLGRVVDIDMTVDLETYSGYPIKDINSKKLLRMKSFVPGDYVICGPWLGKVMKAYDVVTILFDDGASCTIMTGEENLTPVFPSQTEDSPLTFYPGQHVRVKLPTFSKSVRWLCGSWKDYRDTGIVSNVEVGSVCVNWVACVQGDISSTPSSIKDPQDLTLLSCFPHTSWQLGDWCRIISDNLHSPMMLSGNSSPTVAPLNFNQMEQLGGDDISCMQLCVIVKRKARVNVQWQNGSYLNGLDSQSLCPVNTIGDHEFWPGQFVLEKIAPGDLCALSRGRLGVVHSVDARERTVNVKWKVTDGETTKYKFFEETASAYELIEHPDISYFFGDVVLRLLPHMESVEERLIEDESSTWNWSEDASFKEFGSPLACQKDISKGKNTNGYLSCIGNVIGFKYEGIEVRWASGHVSLVQPSEIFVLDKLNEPTMLIEENSSENVIKEGATQDRTSLLKEKSLNNLDGADEKDRQDSAELFSHYIVRCFRNIATSLFGQNGSTSLACQVSAALLQVEVHLEEHC
ncbi:putative ubiquitin-conjugating enzyme E2 24 [Apostasia shenzhenica]|uniref:Putative ubiquitin-conjugating enzyme E2 24 n=1 Tax=Apostasia shenzhenica TaxID=1088818 RepID=A0A2H9ZZP7_9ASPA|nr:putative ubiquitin-conjugating enzyme E2 24 [Apostasia shenzhenica]